MAALTEKQISFCKAFAQSQNVTEAANAADLSRQRAYKLLKDEAIQAEIERHRTELHDSATAEENRQKWRDDPDGTLIETCERILDDPRTKPSELVRTAELLNDLRKKKAQESTSQGDERLLLEFVESATRKMGVLGVRVGRHCETCGQLIT